MNFIEKILHGFNSILSFLGGALSNLGNLIADSFTALFDFLEKPLSYVFYFFDGLFYFFLKLFDIIVLVLKVIGGMFQFMGALIAGVFRTIRMWLVVDIHPDTKFPSASNAGFQTVIDLVTPTGLITVVPVVAIAFCWFFFALKMISLFGGSISVSPFGKGGK
jgi:hypothetical protein